MTISGQDHIESVDQAMFLTLQPKGVLEGDLMQSAGCYREGANLNRGGNPWIIRKGSPAALTAGRLEPMLVRWVGPRITGDQVQILNAAGNVVWASSARQGLPEADDSMRGETWTGVTIPTMDSGTLYLTYRESGRTP